MTATNGSHGSRAARTAPNGPVRPGGARPATGQALVIRHDRRARCDKALVTSVRLLCSPPTLRTPPGAPVMEDGGRRDCLKVWRGHRADGDTTGSRRSRAEAVMSPEPDDAQIPPGTTSDCPRADSSNGRPERRWTIPATSGACSRPDPDPTSAGRRTPRQHPRRPLLPDEESRQAYSGHTAGLWPSCGGSPVRGQAARVNRRRRGQLAGQSVSLSGRSPETR